MKKLLALLFLCSVAQANTVINPFNNGRLQLISSSTAGGGVVANSSVTFSSVSVTGLSNNQVVFTNPTGLLATGDPAAVQPNGAFIFDGANSPETKFNAAGATTGFKINNSNTNVTSCISYDMYNGQSGGVLDGQVMSCRQGVAGNNGPMMFLTRAADGDGGPTVKMLIAGNGNVGIGTGATALPTALLEVNGGAQFDGPANSTFTFGVVAGTLTTNTQTNLNGPVYISSPVYVQSRNADTIAFPNGAAQVTAYNPSGVFFNRIEESIIDNQDGTNSYTKGAAGTLSQDSVDFVRSTQSIKLGSDGAATAIVAKRTSISPTIDFTGKQIVMYFKIDGLANMAEGSLYLSNDNLTSNFYIFDWSAAAANQTFAYWQEGEWARITLNFGEATRTGSPDRTAINSWQLRIKDKGVAGSTVTVHWNGFTTIPEPPKGIISITDDDGFKAALSTAAQYMDKYGFRGTAYIEPDNQAVGNFLSTSSIIQMEQLHGWELGLHPTGTTLTTISSGTVDSLLYNNKIWMVNYGMGRYLDGMAYPHGGFSPAVTAEVRKYYNYARTIVTGPTNADPYMETVPPADAYRLRSISVSSTTTGAQLFSWASRAATNHEWLILTFHDFPNPPVAATDVSPTTFNTFIDTVAALGLKVMPVGEVLRDQPVRDYLELASSSTVPALTVNAKGNFGTNDGSSGGALFSCVNPGSDGPCVQIYSNQGAIPDLTAPLYVVANNTAWDNPTLYMVAKGTSPQNGIRIDGKDYSTLALEDTLRTGNGSLHNGKFQISTHNDEFRIERRSADNSQYNSVFVVMDSTAPGGVALSFDYTTPVSTFDIQGSVGIGAAVAGNTAAPANGLLLQGNFVMQSGVSHSGTQTKTTTYVATSTDSFVIGDATSAGFTITLPAANAVKGQELYIAKADSSVNALTVKAAGSDKINASTGTIVLNAQGQGMKLISDGSAAWYAPDGIPSTPPYIGTRVDGPSAAQVFVASTTQLSTVDIRQPTRVTGVRVVVGVQSGQCQVGLYDNAGTKLAASTEALCPAPGQQTISFASAVSIQPGIYYLALGADNGTATFAKSSGNGVLGCNNFATSLPMANVTLPGTSTANCIAMIGIVTGGVSQ